MFRNVINLQLTSAGLRPSREKLAGDGGREDPVKEIKLLISC